MVNNIRYKIWLIALVFLTMACEQERLEPVLSAADGGGTLSKFFAYSIAPADGSSEEVNGRIVFWKDKLSRTLIQVSLHNTTADIDLPAMIIAGPIGDDGSVLTELYAISGESGELSDHKFFMISDTEYFDNIPSLDAHINIYDAEGSAILATGNLGLNTEPVELN